MEYTFVLKDKGTNRQGWWLKLSSAEELLDYIEKVNPERFGKALENYLYGKEFHKDADRHSPHMQYVGLTQAITEFAKGEQTIIEAINGFAFEVALRQLENIEKYGCIFINRLGGYHSDYDGPHQYDFVKRKELIFPSFAKGDIRIRKFDGGNHYYAYIDDLQVKDGEKVKWNTYEAAYEYALTYLNKQ